MKKTENCKGKIILTSEGLTQKSGITLIKEALKSEDLSDKKILLFYEPYFSFRDRMKEACIYLGFQEENVFFASYNIKPEQVLEMDCIYVTEGNTHEVLQEMRNLGVVEAVRQAVMKGCTYIGSSAGAMIASKDIGLAKDFDRNHIGMTDFSALHLIDGVVIPHYTTEQLNNYIANCTDEELAPYKNIFAVANGESRIF